ncbi:hypothetical protein JXA47_16460 [Candidatus Sumerlaeota bacterium]|nr:hypothetical protein [Candidatus Sumerlaeota bacterium]
MQRIPLEHAAPGMRLAKTVENESGQTLLPQGTELTEDLIERMGRMRVKRIAVEGHPVNLPGQKPPDPEKIRLDIERAFIRLRDDPTMMELKEMVMRSRLTHAEEVLAEMRAGAGGAEEPGGETPDDAE